MCYEWVLVELAKKIQRIEDKCENYQENKNWKKYRNQQNAIYEKIRKNNEREM